jgi:hypothetical protein
MIETMSSTLIAALLGALVTVFGWYVTYAYTKRMEDRRRRLESHRQYRSQQIEQLYGPLLSLIEQIFNVWQVRDNILTNCRCSPEQEKAIKELIWKQYFTPLHAEIGGLLRTKLYLLEGSILPESFTEYLEHATQEGCQHVLWNELQIDTSCAPGRPWPANFHSEVKTTLKKLMDERQQGLAELQ